MAHEPWRRPPAALTRCMECGKGGLPAGFMFGADALQGLEHYPGCWCRTAMMMAAFPGGSLERPALKRLLDDIRQDQIDVIVVYRIARLSRSLMDFAMLVEVMDAHAVSRFGSRRSASSNSLKSTSLLSLQRPSGARFVRIH